MLAKIVDFSLANRFLVAVGFILVTLFGIYSALTIPIDAVPDMTNTQVQILTSAGSLSPLEVERLVTYPVESTMNGLPHVEEIRSISRLGISVVTVVFKEGTDIYFARNMVKEKLPEAKSRVGEYGDPEIGTLSTALGEIMQFEVRGEGYTPMQLRSILEWQISPQLKTTRGVTEINIMGGGYKSFEVQIDPERLMQKQITLGEIVEALQRNNLIGGGGYIVRYGEQQFIRGAALLKNVEDIGNVVLRNETGTAPLLVRQVADVQIAPLPRQGAATRGARGDVVIGMVMMLFGENSRTVVEAAKAKLEEINTTLPPGVTTEVIYDRAELIGRTLRTVVSNLFEGGALVIVILFVMLGNVRAGLIVALAIPLSMMVATNLMNATAITASLMSLGAIDFGLIVDSSVILIENCMARLSHPNRQKTHDEIIRDAVVEVRKPTLFGELIIAVVYVPILALQGTEGKLFRPMAYTVLFALFGSMLISMLLMPVLAAWLLPKKMEEKEVFLVRWIRNIYTPLVNFAISRPVVTATLAGAIFMASIPTAMRLGAEFMPRLDEGDLLIEVNRLPSATLEDAIPMSTRIEQVLAEFPEVRDVFCKTGRPEIANDVMGVQQTDVWVILNPVKSWPREKTRDELIAEVAERLNREIPGALFAYTQPIEMRVDELVAGVKADVAVLIYGNNLEQLASVGKQIEQLLKGIPGASDVKADIQDNIPTQTITVLPEQLARYGLTAEQVMHTVQAVGGLPVGEVYEDRARYPIIVRFPQVWRENIERLKLLPVGMVGSTPIPLGEVARIELEQSPPGIEHEAGNRRTFVSTNVRGRDVASFVQEAQQRVRQEIKLPTGFSLQWGGDFKNLQSASLRLVLITPIVLVIIWLLLFTTFKSGTLATLIFSAVPVAASGGVFALALRGMPFSISAGVGFIALFGVAVLNSLVWVGHAEKIRLEEGMSAREVSRATAQARIRPVLITALVASFGFLPMAFATTAGAEIQRPLATVVIGGLVTSTALTGFVVPAIYPWFVRSQRERKEVLVGED
jgi:cobalt-zinc-cadmium resistance protein CzcA